MKRQRAFQFIIGAALALSSASASAEKPKRVTDAHSDGYSYTFIDDALLAGSLGALGSTFVIRAGMYRVTLIRPRASFVVEMLKSVEDL